MGQILQFSYDATSETISGQIDATRRATIDGVVVDVPVLGVPKPSFHCTVAEMRASDPQLGADFLDVMQRLDAFMRAKNAEVIAKPEDLQRIANENIEMLKQIATERAALHAEKAAARAKTGDAQES